MQLQTWFQTSSEAHWGLQPNSGGNFLRVVWTMVEGGGHVTCTSQMKMLVKGVRMLSRPPAWVHSWCKDEGSLWWELNVIAVLILAERKSEFLCKSFTNHQRLVVWLTLPGLWMNEWMKPALCLNTAHEHDADQHGFNVQTNSAIQSSSVLLRSTRGQVGPKGRPESKKMIFAKANHYVSC